ARNKISQHARHAGCQQRHEAAMAETDALAAVGTTAQQVEPDPARVAEYNDTVQRLCSDLGDTERRLVELRLQGYSTAEGARQLGVNADVLRVRLSRLRQQLRASQLLAEWI